MLMDYIPGNSTVLVSGDSVTDCGRARPYGDAQTGLGGGYPFFLHCMVTGTSPEKHIKFVNSGISGETSSHVAARWDSDLDAVKPDFATLMIGANDVWRRYDSYMYPEKQVTDEQFESNIKAVIASSKKRLKGLMLISPVFIDLNKNDDMRRDFDRLNEILKRLTAESGGTSAGIVYCDAQAEVDKLMAKQHPTVYSADRIHPFPVTHYAIARCILNAVGFKL